MKSMLSQLPKTWSLALHNEIEVVDLHRQSPIEHKNLVMLYLEPSQPGVTVARADCKLDNLSVICSLYSKERERQQKKSFPTCPVQFNTSRSLLQGFYCCCLIREKM
ncbi:hypothetical protein RRG08_010040 [Elysia crispata]|uniref:Uncharacterized protein n=1 Tax=Elysia crispata TaxID=231223 RepID=A0AAE1B8B1_9GAST|nr:hypothetical protein RRG08_010040 [Elysia crispata]